MPESFTLNELTKIWWIFRFSSPRAVLFLLFVSVILAIFETVGVASIAPLMAIILDEDIGQKYVFFQFVESLIQPKSHFDFVAKFGAAFLALIAFVNCLSAFSIWLISSYCYQLQKGIGIAILSTALRLPYDQLTKLNNAELLKSTFLSSNQVVLGLVLPLLQLISRSLVSVLILITLFLADPVLAAGISVTVSSLYAIIYFTSLPYLKKIGRSTALSDGRRMRIATEFLNSNKEIRLANVSEYFLDKFEKETETYAKGRVNSTVLASIPRNLMEIIGVSGLLAVLVFKVIVQEETISQALPLISLYAVAAWRLMPALQLVYHSVSQVKFNMPTLAVIFEFLQQLDTKSRTRTIRKTHAFESQQNNVSPLPFQTLSFKTVDFSYPDEGIVIRAASFEISAGETVAIIGPSGSGKTTLIELMVGLLKPTAGQVIVNGVNLQGDNLRGWQDQISYVSQKVAILDGTIDENVCFGMELSQRDASSFEEAIEAAQLHEVYDDLLSRASGDVGEGGTRLSGGQAQRVGIARALFRGGDVLILDEATNSLDGNTENKVLKTIQQRSEPSTLILVTHKLSLLEHCDKFLFVSKGAVKVFDSFQSLSDSNEAYDQFWE